MIKLNKSICLLATVALLTTTLAYAETDELQTTEASLETSAQDPAFAGRVQSKYNLSEAQMKAMNDAGIKGPHLAMTAQLAASSGKPVEDIIKMRTEDKMGWGKIAKTLGVQPGEIGKSVSSLRHEANEDRKDAKADRKEAKEDRKQMQEERKAEHKANKEERKNKKDNK